MGLRSDQASDSTRLRLVSRGSVGGRPHVVIVGAGFGGLTAAKGLAKAAVEVTLIDRENHHLFQPLLYQVATAGLSPAEIAWPIRGLVRRQRNTRVLLGEVTGVDRERHVVTMGHREVPYDFLVLATGATHAYFGNDGWAEHAPGLKSIDDATEIRRRLLIAFERAEMENDPEERERLLTIVIVGGGPTGVEMAGAVAELARKALAADFRTIDPRHTRVLLIEAGPRLLPTFPEDLSRYAERALRSLGVEVWLGRAITGCDAAGVTLREERLPAGTVIWAAGVAASPAAAWLGVEADRAGRVKVGARLTPPGSDDVFVIGDTALVLAAPGTGSGRKARRRLRGRGDQGAPCRQDPRAALSLSGAGQARHDRPAGGNHRVRRPAAKGVACLVDLGHRPHLLPDQPSQSADRGNAMALVLRRFRARRAADHRHASEPQA